MVFDAKITLDRKCRLVADRRRVEEDTTYSSVDCLLLAALNDCDVMAAGIQNEYPREIRY